MPSDVNQMWSWLRKHGGIFIPEVLPAVYFVLISPIWEIQLIGRGKALAAIALPVGIGLGCLVFYQACRDQLRWMGFVAIVVVLATAYAAYQLGK